MSTSSQEYYQNNKEKIKAKAKKYREANPDKEKARHARNSRTLKVVFALAVSSARKRGLSWTISLEEFELLRKSRCSYCQSALPETGAGLDRVDNSKGYELGNVNPCCSVCNQARNNYFTVEEMKTDIGPAIQKVNLNRSNTLTEFCWEIF